MDRLLPFFFEVSRQAAGPCPARAKRDYLYSTQRVIWKHVRRDNCQLNVLFNRWTRRSRMGVIATIMTELASERQKSRGCDDRRDPREGSPDRIGSSGSKVARGWLIGRTKGGSNSKLHFLAGAICRPIGIFLSAGQTSVYIGARAQPSSIPQAGALLADRGYDADWFRNALVKMGISPCIPSRRGRKVPILHNADLYRQRH